MESETEADGNQFDNLQSLLSRPSFRTLAPLDDAIDVYRHLVGLEIIPGAQKKTLHLILSDLLLKRYQEKRMLVDLNDAITSAKSVSSYYEGNGNDKRQYHLETLGVLLYERFVRKQAPEDINESIQVFQQAADATNRVDLHSIKLINQLATCFHARFHITKSKNDLDTSISMTEKAIQIAHSKDSSRTKIILQHNLSARLVTRFENVGNVSDLEQAQNINLEALLSVRDEECYRAELLMNRARIAFTRFRRSYFWKDLDEAKNFAKEAFNLGPTDPSTLVVIHQNLAIFHLQSFEVGKSAADLRVALQNAKSAIAQSEKMKLHIDSTQETLFQYYQTALLQKGGMADLQNLLDVLENQIDRMPKPSPWNSKREQYLNLLGLKFQHTGDHTDIIFLCREALHSLRIDNQGTNAKTNTEKEKLVDALSYFMGEIFRYLLTPEFVHVRDGFIITLHDEFLKYKHEGVLGALKSILQKSEVFSFRTNSYMRDPKTRHEDVYNHIAEIAEKMERVRNNPAIEFPR